MIEGATGGGGRAAVALALAALALLAGCRTPEPPAFDLVLAGGRVMDPESGLDAVRHVGIRGDRIAAISEAPLDGAEVLDVAVDSWYAARRGKAVIHYGAAVGHIPARLAVKHGIEIGHPNTNPTMAEAMKLVGWRDEPLETGERERLLEMLDKGLAAGALGIGLAIQYSPGATRQEVLEVLRLAARLGAPVFVHARHSGNLDAEGGLASRWSIWPSAIRW